MPFPSPCGTLILDSAFYFSTNDAHSGSHALELRNAKCDSDDELFGGSVHLMESDSFYFDSGAEFDGGAANEFSFYYKFFKAGNDTAMATVTLSNDFSGDIATATVLIEQSASEYTKITVPIEYKIAEIPNRVSITFANQTQTSTPTYGTRLLIDDVTLTSNTNVVRSEVEASHVRCFPNPATDIVTFTSGTGDDRSIDIATSDGKHIYSGNFRSTFRLDCSKFASGVYLYQIGDRKGSFIVK
jgi:hypothetical protein